MDYDTYFRDLADYYKNSRTPSKVSDVGSPRRVVEGAGPQRPAGPVRADDDARGHSLGADEREFAWRRSI